MIVQPSKKPDLRGIRFFVCLDKSVAQADVAVIVKSRPDISRGGLTFSKFS